MVGSGMASDRRSGVVPINIRSSSISRPSFIGKSICLFGQKGMEPVGLDKTEVSEAG